MKKNFFLIIAVLSFSFAQAQLSFVSKDSTLVKDFYAGYLGGTSFKKNLEHSWLSSVRMGAGFSYQATNRLQFVAFGATDISSFNNYDISAFGAAFANYKVSKVLTLQAGNIPSSITRHFKPYILNRENQYGFESVKTLPGVGLGVKSIINYNSFTMELNAMKRDYGMEAQVYMGKNGTEAGLFYSSYGFGGVFSLKKENFSWMFILKQNEKRYPAPPVLYDSEDHNGDQAYPQSGMVIKKTTTIGGNWMLRVHKKKNIWIYHDLLYEDPGFSFIELGVSKAFQSGNLGGFINLSWVYDKKTGKEIRLAYMLSL